MCITRVSFTSPFITDAGVFSGGFKAAAGSRLAPGGMALDCHAPGGSHRNVFDRITDSLGEDRDIAGQLAELSKVGDALDALTDRGRRRLHSAAFDQVEAATDQLRAGIQRLCDHPADAQAMRELRYAALELQRTVTKLADHSEVGVHRSLQCAVNAFEGATAVLVQAPYRTDGAALLREALSDMLGSLRAVTRQFAPLAAGADQSVPSSSPGETPAQELQVAAQELDEVADGLKGQIKGPEFRAVEAVIDELKAAAERLALNPNDPEAGMAFEAAAHKLKKAIQGLENVLAPGLLGDKGAYKALQHAAVMFERAADALNIGSPQSRLALADKFQNATATLREVTDNLENLAPSCNPQSPSTWRVDQANRTIYLDNGYRLKFDNKDQSWHILDAKGNAARIWGDPHVVENDGGKWDFKHGSTFMLKDGTKITVQTRDAGNGQTLTDTVTVTKGDQAIRVTGVADNRVQIGGVTHNGRALDRATNDGYVFHEENGVDDWLYEGGIITSNQAMEGPRQHEESLRRRV